MIYNLILIIFLGLLPQRKTSLERDQKPMLIYNNSLSIMNHFETRLKNRAAGIGKTDKTAVLPGKEQSGISGATGVTRRSRLPKSYY